MSGGASLGQGLDRPQRLQVNGWYQFVLDSPAKNLDSDAGPPVALSACEPLLDESLTARLESQGAEGGCKFAAVEFTENLSAKADQGNLVGWLAFLDVVRRCPLDEPIHHPVDCEARIRLSLLGVIA